MKLLSHMLCLLLLVMALHIKKVSAYIDLIEVWKNNKQTIVGLGDYHDHSKEINCCQKKAVHAFLESNYKSLNNSKFIVEDFKAYDGNNKIISDFVDNSEAIVPQTSLVEKIHGLGLLAKNIEFRYFRMAGLLPLISKEESWNFPYSLTSSKLISTSEIALETYDVIERIKKFKDGNVLNSYYDEVLKNMDTQDESNKFSLLKKSNKSMYDFLYSEVPYNRLTFLYSLWDFGQELINALTIHELASVTQSRIALFLGREHTKCIGSVLCKTLAYATLLKLHSIDGISENTIDSLLQNHLNK